MRTVLADGCFDILHPGHIRYLQQARCYGDRLIVSLASDERVAALKGKGRPYLLWEARATILRALSVVEEVLLSSAAHTTIAQLKPDVYCKGEHSDVTIDAKICDVMGVKLVMLPLWNEAIGLPYSSSNLIARIQHA